MTDKKLETKIEYYDNGIVECVYNVDQNGVEQGPTEWYYDNGQLYSKGAYKDGYPEGPSESYYRNGLLNNKCFYKNGRQEGVSETYRENGLLWERETFKNGKYNGLCETYYDNGALHIKCYYKYGKLNGPYEEYWTDGLLRIKYTYKMGKKLFGKAEADYLKKWKEKHFQKKNERERLNARLLQIDKQMAPTKLRQDAKRAEVAKFRAQFLGKNRERE